MLEDQAESMGEGANEFCTRLTSGSYLKYGQSVVLENIYGIGIQQLFFNAWYYDTYCDDDAIQEYLDQTC